MPGLYSPGRVTSTNGSSKSSGGVAGFKGSRKSTPFAAQIAAALDKIASIAQGLDHVALVACIQIGQDGDSYAGIALGGLADRIHR